MKIYNTLYRRKEEFKPLRFPEVKLYQCGPTVYNNAHIGNLKTSVVEDVVARSLKYLGYQVKVTMNITDIDDKTIKNSVVAGESLKDFTEKYTKVFLDDLEKLGVELPENITPISKLIPEMVRMIQTMLNRGFAYLADDGSIYFDVKKSKRYGQLANLDISGMKESVRIDNDEYDKDSAADFVLWKAWKKDDAENYWEGEFTVNKKEVVLKGRPGWHIECSACAMKHCGPQIDIHMGGEDLIFPHHQNEIAQTEACTGKQFSKYWIHSGHLMVDGKKMSKSLGNFYTLRDIEEKYPSEPRLLRAVRMGFINGLYREQINFSFEKLEQNIKTLENIDETCKRLVRYMAEFSGVRPEFRDYMQEVIQGYTAALEDDFAFPEAFAIMFDFQKYISVQVAEGILTLDEQNAAVDMYMQFNQVFNILDVSIFEGGEDIPEEILHKAIARDEAKIEKDFALSDTLRDEMVAAGYKVIDTKQGTVVEKA
ncbi:cysteine--tRNA ligase [Candidatus Gracilibacteria bacterium]|nr:cysteine--tRNA ligase [Candidatus Gracilibacteria bacterium]